MILKGKERSESHCARGSYLIFRRSGSAPYMAVERRSAAKLLFVETALTLCVDAGHSWTDHRASVQGIAGMFRLRSPGSVTVRVSKGQQRGFFPVWFSQTRGVFNS